MSWDCQEERRDDAYVNIVSYLQCHESIIERLKRKLWIRDQVFRWVFEKSEGNGESKGEMAASIPPTNGSNEAWFCYGCQSPRWGPPRQTRNGAQLPKYLNYWELLWKRVKKVQSRRKRETWEEKNRKPTNGKGEFSKLKEHLER